MSNVQPLTPAALDGVKYSETVEVVDRHGNRYGVEVRPLAHPGAKRVQRFLSGSLRFSGSLEAISQDKAEATVDAGALVEARFDANLAAAAAGTVSDEWTEETIAETWPAEWVETVGERVMELSGIETPSDTEGEGKGE